MAWQDHQPSTQEKRRHGLGRKERACAQAMPSPKKRWKVKNINPKAYVCFTPHKLNSVGAFFGRIGLPPAVMDWAASCGNGLGYLL